MDNNSTQGIAIDTFSIKKSEFRTAQQYDDATQSHRDEGHTFHIVQNGTVYIEIDFQKYKIVAPAIVYMHPNQVHRMMDIRDMTVCSLAITNDHLNIPYLKYLEEIAPAKPLILMPKEYKTVNELSKFCLNFSKENDNRLNYSLFKDSCNTLVAYIISIFLDQEKPSNKLSRMELVTKSFQQLLETNYCTTKRAAEYAKLLSISTHYLNECLKSTTGSTVSQRIQDRVILEAKRLLYYTDKSVKEIAFELGYDDYPYFSRLFTKATGLSAQNFRRKRYD
ncbi:helix-turn-helix domain-containing protein [Rhizosphaericola mali]|uniref:Helix-turn-helix domain-containing protein n=1 Tax=Rhizosphaericola mali TaxID=2545455 RepID=A0A5P2G5W2_9BACT|nr:helix-turn-helix domain-containing protein [Rhizosphaericola mali]